MLPGLSPISDGRNQQMELHKATADRASLLMRCDKRSSLGCAVGESTLVYIRETERGLSTRLQLVAQGSFQLSFVHESSHPDCYMPDLSPHKAHSGIQICQAQQVRKLRLTMLGTYSQAVQELLYAQYFMFNFLGLSQNFYFYIGFPAVTGVQTALKTDKMEQSKGSKAAENARESGYGFDWCERIWGNLGKSCNEIFLFPQSSPLRSCFQLLWWSYVSRCIPALLQLCSDPILHKIWPAGVLHCLLSAVPERSFCEGEGKAHFDHYLTSAVRAIWEEEWWPQWPLFLSPFSPHQILARQPLFWLVVFYLLMSLCETTMALSNHLTWHAKHAAHVLLCDHSYLTSNCVKQIKVSPNNNKVGTHLKADARPSYI